MTETTEHEAAPKPVMLNDTQGIILACLHSGNKAGADVDAIVRQMDPIWHVTRSQIYRELPIMADRGFVKITRTLPDRKWAVEYAITPEGEKIFRTWWENEDQPDQLRNPWLLRAYLTGQLEAIPSYAQADLWHRALVYYTETLGVLNVIPEDARNDFHEFHTAYNKLLMDTFANWAARA